jgi:hypothetical protein
MGRRLSPRERFAGRAIAKNIRAPINPAFSGGADSHARERLTLREAPACLATPPRARYEGPCPVSRCIQGHSTPSPMAI